MATASAMAVVLLELAVIAWIRHRYMDTPLFAAMMQGVLGGLIIFGVGSAVGSS